ncbi:MAG: UbiA family prenyltransferase [Anaerolineae bacterium]
MSSHSTSTPNTTWRDKLYGYFALARVSNSPTVFSNTLAGAALAGVTSPNSTVIMIAIAMIAFYTAGMYLNDILDYEIDLKERADRPLTTGLISRNAAMTVTLLLFGFGIAILLSNGARSFIGGLVLIGLIVLYDAWHKKNPLSPVIMGANRFMVYIVAFVTFQVTLTGEVLLAAGLLWVYIIALTFIAKSETRADFTRYWPVAVLLAPAVVFGVQLLDDPVWLLLVVAFVGWVLFSVSFIYRKTGRSIGGAIVRLIAGVSLFDAIVMATVGATTGVILALAAFILTLFFQQYIKGT